jgi:FKBP-type peptidyl-prolyl cis-trans isomerase
LATSRRRERELARRRYERRRQAELERRARAKRRNTIVGAVSGTAIVIAVLLVLTFTVFTGGEGNKAAAKPTTSPSVSASATPAAATKCAAIKPNPPIKGAPRIPPVQGKPPTKLQTKDIKVGHGRAAKNGDSLDVFYTGVSCSDGKMFDSSYKSSPASPFTVSPLGTAGVIQGWNEGLVGVKAGGVRELIIPPDLGYGASGSGGIKPNETLLFVVEVKSVKAG